MESDPVLERCVLSGNEANGGGGIYISNDSFPRLTGCSITSNSVVYSGSGIYCSSGGLTAEECLISGNITERNGGGVFSIDANLVLSACVVIGNESGYNGGGIQISGEPESFLTNCTIAENTAGRNGGGVRIWTSAVTLTCCTIAGNSAAGSGDGITGESAEITLLDCIVWGNGDDEIDLSGCETNVTYCDVQGGWPGEGNIDEEPCFKGGGDYHIQESSPCRDNGAMDGAPQVDIDGDPRPWGGECDIGSDEVMYDCIGTPDTGPAGSSGSIALSPPRPNPCNPVVVFSFTIEEGDTARLTIYDLTGRQIAVPADGIRGAGSHSAAWKTDRLPSGVYFCRLCVSPGGETVTRKFAVLK